VDSGFVASDYSEDVFVAAGEPGRSQGEPHAGRVHDVIGGMDLQAANPGHGIGKKIDEVSAPRMNPA